MRIYIKPFGILDQYLERQGLEVDLPDGSTLASLYDALDGLWQSPPPPDVWDAAHRRFTLDHLVFVDGRMAHGEAEPLAAGSKVMLIPPLEGGRA